MSGELRGAEQTVRRSLQTLTGFEYAVFAPTGTAALELLLLAHTRKKARVGVPALGCWTLPYAVSKLGRRPLFCEMDRAWGAVAPSGAELDAMVMVDPWGAPSDWRQAVRQRGAHCWLVDLTHAPGASMGGALPGQCFDGGFLSFGGGKPVGLGGGGVALFNDPIAAREAHRQLRFGFRDGRWQRWTDRYTFSPHLYPPLAAALTRLLEGRTIAPMVAELGEVFADGLLQPMPLRAQGRWGSASVVPLVVPRRFPLSPRELEAVALSSGVPLARHPVGPAYLEPAWGRRAFNRCPRAERLSPRLLFYSVRADGSSKLLALRAFLEEVLAQVERYRTPYALPPPSGALPEGLGQLARTARLVRKLNGDFGLLDEEFDQFYPVSGNEAAWLQARHEDGDHSARSSRSRERPAKAARKSAARGKGSP